MKKRKKNYSAWLSGAIAYDAMLSALLAITVVLMIKGKNPSVPLGVASMGLAIYFITYALQRK